MLFTVIVSAILFVYIYFYTKDEKIGTICSGIATGLIVAACQLLIQGLEHRDIENVKKLKIKKILPTRDDKELYGDLIGKANEKIWLLGNTAFRFFEDFADENRTDRQVLLRALDKQIDIRILLPKKEFITNKKDKINHDTTNERMIAIKEKYPNFSFKYYEEFPSHSLLIIDDDCLVGPIFKNIRSKDSPAILTDVSSNYVKPYISFYHELWNNSNA